MQPPPEPLPVATVLPPSFTHQKSYSSILNRNPKSDFPPALSEDDVACFRRSYPNLIIIPRTIVDYGCQPWKLSLVGKFLGRSISLDKVHLGLSALWNPQSDWEIFAMAYGYFIFRFTSPSDLDWILFDGPCVLDDVVLALGHWTPDFRPSPLSLPRVTVWMRLPEVLRCSGLDLLWISLLLMLGALLSLMRPPSYNTPFLEYVLRYVFRFSIMFLDLLSVFVFVL